MPTKKKSPPRPQPAQAAKKSAVKKAAVKKAPAKTAAGKAKTAAKQAPARKPAVKKPVLKKAVVKKAATKKPGVKKAPAQPAPAKKPPAKKSAAKPAAPAKPGAARRPASPVSASTMSKSTSRPAQGKTAKAPSPKASTQAPTKPAAPGPAPKAQITPAAKAPAPKAGKAGARALLRKSILGRQKTHRPASFSLDEAREIAQTATPGGAAGGADKKTKSAAKAAALEPVKPAQPNHVQAASLADILGFTPGKSRHPDEEVKVPEKFKRYYKLLLELRDHLTGQIDQHSEETLKRSAKDDAGDLSSYGQHMADAGTDTFDRDFALSLVSSEQEALSEVEAAIRRIKNGSYGVCEVTGQPIAKERLLAVPFTRYSAEAQKEIERHRHRVRTQAGLFGEMGEDAPKISDGGDDE